MWIGHFVVDPTQRGQSHGFLLAKALLAAAFGQYAATDVLLVVFPENLGAIRCYERAGMVVNGREEKYFETTHRRHCFLRMGINRAKYLRLAAAGRLPTEPLPFHTDLPADRRVAGDGGRASDRT
jgi:ribosomal protein S18 acetylase RimI-like enzyme